MLLPARPRLKATASTTAPKAPKVTSLLPALPSDSEKNSDSRMTAAKSATDAPAMVSWPSRESSPSLRRP
jgi:hypothetical protein